jgi:hypothetical protein
VFLTTGQAGAVLGCSAPTIQKLMATGLIPGTERPASASGTRRAFPYDALQALQQLPEADLTAFADRPEIAVLRPSAPQRVAEDDRDWIGFGTSMTAPQLLAALSRWWRCNPHRVAASGVLPVTVAGFTVAVLTGLNEWEPDGRKVQTRYHFTGARLAGYLTDLTRPANALQAPAAEDKRLADLLLGTRLHSVSSGPIAYVPTTPPQTTEQNGAHP